MKYINSLNDAMQLSSTLPVEILVEITRDISILMYAYGIEKLNSPSLESPGHIIILEESETISSLDNNFPHLSLNDTEFTDEILCSTTDELWIHQVIIYATESSLSIYQKK